MATQTDPTTLPYPVVGQPCQIYDPAQGDQPLAGVVTAVIPGGDPDVPAVMLLAFLSNGETQPYKAAGYTLLTGGSWGHLPPA